MHDQEELHVRDDEPVTAAAALQGRGARRARPGGGASCTSGMHDVHDKRDKSVINSEGEA